MLCAVSNICLTHQLYLYLYLYLFFSLYLCIDSINCGKVSPMLSCYLPDKPILDESSHAFFQTGSSVCSHKSLVTSFFVANLYQPSQPVFVFVLYLLYLFHICLYLCQIGFIFLPNLEAPVCTNFNSPSFLKLLLFNSVACPGFNQLWSDTNYELINDHACSLY